MIQKLAKLGKIIPENMFPDNPLGLNLDFEMDYIVFLEFNHQNEQWQFNGVTIEEFKKSHSDKYLIQTSSGNFTPEFPSFPVYDFNDLKDDEAADINFKESKVGKRVLRCLKKYQKQFDGIKNHLIENENVKKELKEKTVDLDQALLSFKLDGSYIGDSKWLEKKISNIADAGAKENYTFNNKKYEATDKLCSITNNVESTIWGFVSPYNFYAVKTELGSVPGGFDARIAWKNFPVSPKGAEYLARAEQFLKEYLRFRFCGINYFLVPERVLDIGDEGEFLDYIQDFKRFCLSRENGSNNRLEEDLIDLMKEKDNSASYTLFFYEENNAEFKILASVEDVFPSYTEKISSVKKSSENHQMFKGLKRKKEKYNLNFAFSHIKEFIPEQAGFLEIVRSIFMQKPIDYDFLMGRVVNKFQIDYANEELYHSTPLKAFLLLKFIQKLNLIKQTKTSDMVTMENKYEKFFDEHADFFNASATKKAVFLEGVLAQKLLNIQYQERGATPFRNRLNSLKISERIIKRLLPEMIEKLEQYNKNYYRELEEIISSYLLSAKFELSDDELSFYFTMGMNLAGQFKTEQKEELITDNE